MSTTLYRGGFVYAAGMAGATAMLVDEDAGLVTWLGDEAAADRLGRPDRVVELAGALAAPAFVDAWTVPGAARREAAVRSGTAALHVTAGLGSAADDDSTEADTAIDAAAGVATVVYWHGPPARRPAGARSATTSSDPAVVGAFVREATDAGRQCSLSAGDDPAAVLRGVEAAAHAGGSGRAVASCGHRLVAGRPLTDAVVAALSRYGMIVVATAVGDGGVDLRALATAGVPFAFGGFGSGAAGPWAAVRHASDPGAGAISARAAFAAATRGGHRAAGAVGGDLRPGAEASFAVWVFEGGLVVRTPDSRLAAWSTDPRAATPGLPDLDLGTPRWQQLVIAGRAIAVTDR